MYQINQERLMRYIFDLAKVGEIEGGGCCRLALTEADKQGRDLVVQWMHDLHLDVEIDAIGNVFATRKGRLDLPPVMTGSHIDTVRTGGKYDGNLGVLAGLEVIATLNDLNIETDHPITVAFFTNEEGARFAPDMMGSLVFQGGLGLEDALNTVGIDGSSVKDNLNKIGYAGPRSVGNHPVHAFMELHVEQGPVLEQAQKTIGVVTGVQGIYWTEFTVTGVSNHAGTTPMHLRHDAGAASAAIIHFAQSLPERLGLGQLATTGMVQYSPNLINVIPNKVTFTVDLRNVDATALKQASELLFSYTNEIASKHGVEITHRNLADFQPVNFNKEIINLVESFADSHSFSHMHLPSGAGHDAQILAAMCPSGMIFVPSVKGLSHNVAEFTSAEDIAAGANILINSLVHLATA